MSRELISHQKVLEYSSLWQDTIRGGEFTLTNTNRLVRYYDGCNGLKTGSTSKAGFCMSATAKRTNMQLIAVVMGAPTRDTRNSIARSLLDYGFANYALYEASGGELESIPVLGGCTRSVMVYSKGFSALVNKSDISRVELKYSIPEKITAPLNAEDVVGKIEFFISGKLLGASDIYVNEQIPKIDFTEVYKRVIALTIFGKKS
jgi:D-alanyl-D-alanine carboxypeptidase (penicillin-binding protein 5/6)